MKGLDEYITQSDDREPVEDVYQIEGYEREGTFHTEEEALEDLLTTELSEKEFPRDYIYIKEAE